MRAFAFCLALGLCLTLSACAGQPVETGKTRSITVADEQPVQIVFDTNLQNTRAEGAVYALLSTSHNGGLPQPASIGEYSLQKSYTAASGTPCAVITAPAADSLLACRDAGDVWHVKKSMLDENMIFGARR